MPAAADHDSTKQSERARCGFQPQHQVSHIATRSTQLVVDLPSTRTINQADELARAPGVT